MAKTSGLGDNFYIGGYDLSGDVSAITQLGGGPATLDVTGIKQDANARIGGERAGDWQFTSFFNASAGAEHPILSSLPTTDTIACYFRGTTLLTPAAAISAVQLNYDPTRGTDGSLTLAVELQSDKYGMEWGTQLTAGLRTDTTATVGTYADDNGAASNYGAQAYWQLIAFTGTSVDIEINHSASSGSGYSTLMSTGALTGIGSGRLSVSNSTTVDRYLEVTTTGTFTLATFAVAWVRNQVAVTF